jgi:aminopeptidase YwaD
MKSIDFKNLARECLTKTIKLTGSFSSRLAGSDMCNQAAFALHDELKTFCDSSSLHSFKIHPGSFYGYTKILPPVYLAGIVTFFLPDPWTFIPLAGLLMGIWMMIVQFGFFSDFFDRLYRKKRAINVIGTLEPEGQVRQQIIISGHHDSAPVTRLFDHRIQKYLAFTMFTPYLFFIYEIFLSLYALLAGIKMLPPGFVWALIPGIPFVVLYFFAVDLKHGTPGAGDNMIASVITVLIGKKLAEAKKDNPALLKHTRIILISFDAEELGLRGAYAYFRDYRPELTSRQTYHLNLESLYKLRDLHVLETDVNGFQKLSKDMAGHILRIARDKGITISPFKMLFGGGGTDAAASARQGLTSTTIFGLPISVFRDGMVYHTSEDTVDHIEPEIVSACLKLVWEYIFEMENVSSLSV